MALNEEKYWTAISTIIKMEMTANGNMSQAKLATAAGVGREAMNNYLSGKREMPITVFMRVADALGVTPHWIFQEAEKRMGRG